MEDTDDDLGWLQSHGKGHRSNTTKEVVPRQANNQVAPDIDTGFLHQADTTSKLVGIEVPAYAFLCFRDGRLRARFNALDTGLEQITDRFLVYLFREDFNRP